jgi:hypothetical protein
MPSQRYRMHALSAEEMMLATLSFLPTGSFLRVIVDLSGLDKSTISRTGWKIIKAIARLRQEFICMPGNEEEVIEVKQGFYTIARFPNCNCIGAFDCTHVKILSPGGENAELYRVSQKWRPIS